MSNDEQTIYISPEDDLTNVRERLENLPSRRITLVIPRQTMLRSHVAWRNLYARAKELEKDVLIISADAQIRSLAQAAKFRVAHSLESSPTGKSRLGMKSPVRSNSNPRMRSTQLRPSGGRTTASEPDIVQPERPDPSTRGQSRITRGSNTSSTFHSPESTMPISNEVTTGGLHAPEATYTLPDNSYAQSYDYKIDAPSFKPQPLSPQHFEEEPDLLDEDYRKTLDIQSVVESKRRSIDATPTATPATPTTPSSPSTPKPREPREATYQILPLPTQEEDPFFIMEDDALPPIPHSEQHGEVSIEGFDTAEQHVQDISETPTEVMHNDIEYQGDLGDFVHPQDGPDFVRHWMDAMPEDEQDMAGPSGTARAYGIRTRSSRGGKTPPPSTPQGGNVEGFVSPFEDFPTMPPQNRPSPAPTTQAKPASTGPRFTPPEEMSKPAPPLPSIPLTPARGVRPSQKLPPQTNKPAPSPQTGQRAGTGAIANRGGNNRPNGPATKSRAGSAPTPKTTRTARPTRQPQRRQGLRGGSIFVAVILLFFILLGLIAFVYPTADVTITVTSRDFSSPVTLLANTQNATKPGSVPVTTVTQTFPRNGSTSTGTGTVSGSTSIGTARATGTVTFTNNGSALVDIPTGTIIETTQGIQFTTTADALVGTGNSNSIPAPVQAQQQGESGNVPAGAITVIPPSSLSTIAAQPHNPPLANLKLAVSNDSALSGGGVGTAAVVAQSDIDKVKQSLRAQMQPDIAAWEKQQTHPGDVAGNATTTEILIDAPKPKQTVDGGSFTMGLKLTVTLPIVRNVDIQNAAVTALNDTLSKSKQPSNANYHVADDANHLVAIQNLKTTQTATGLTLTFTAKGKIVPNIAIAQAQQLIIGKFKQDAKAVLKQSIQNVENVDITTNPAFYPLIPYLKGHITIHFIPGTTQK